MDHPSLTWREVRNTLLVNLLVWGLLCAVGAASVYSDVLREGGASRSYGRVMLNWDLNHALMMSLSFGLYLAFRRWPQLVSSARAIARCYAMVVFIFLPLQLVFMAGLDAVRTDGMLDAAHAWRLFLSPHGFDVFLEFAWSTGTFTAVTAICIWRGSQARDKAWQQALTDNLHLNLELERQRMLALRSQLEPHFIFNALNAISALVRTSDGDLALNGINRLSDLLRYALTASGRDWVSVGEELAFVGDYLALQRLRYRARLQVQMDIGDVHGGECPPLLLQPLIENALRHDLDCHEGPSDIRIVMQREGAQLRIRISNPVAAEATPNPGLGLGLANTRARLQLAYRGAASLESALRDGRFEAEIRMPLHPQE
ncbi:sensor histidine kinase [Rugamonas sp. FT82W]|uniref:Sensor histidine kinase n=1 Tax=Duganella vulcania TaxID=2692166 RepID=A0A845G222_9BURK|nr:histidine kinase [Duganella vulcania]MYM87901.1 sensor histidine kinase [Duganella vulcania]